MVQQTAVEWLWELCEKKGGFNSKDLEQANQMHKEQIIKAWIDAERYNDSISKPLAEKYYNETYGKE